MTHESGSLLSNVKLNMLEGSTSQKENVRESLKLGYPDFPLNGRWAQGVRS